MKTKKYKITSKEQDGDYIYLNLTPNDGENIEFKAGQFVKVLDPKKQENPKFRFYSVASSPTTNHLEFLIQVVGKFTNHIKEMNVGDEFDVSGPLGNFKYEDGQKNVILIGGGSGIAPLMSILRYVDQKKIEGKFILFYSCRSTKTLAFYKKLKKLNDTNPNIDVVFTLTRECPDNWSHKQGRINEEMIKKYISDLSTYSAFLCGPVKMTMALRKFLVELGIDDSKVKVEGWG